ncbi:MAG: TonB-dependent receptor [Betaproteobacteria bacterium]|nr:TonB-dependent receptor [Betaproteobacteria bacterium]
MRRVVFVLAPCVAGGLLMAADAFGQGAAPVSDERVVVSATRAEQKAIDVPAAIDSVTSEQLQLFQPKVNLSETLNRVPGISIQNRQNYSQDLQVTSRGYGGRAQFGVRGVRLIADGVPATMPDGAGQAATFSIGSADRIEVLRGPFASLYGNASGGLIQIFTAEGPPAPEIGGEFWAGSYGSARLAVRPAGQSGAVNYIGDISRFTTDGYRDHSAATRDQTNARLRIGLDGGARLSFVLNALNQADTQDPLGLTRAQAAANPRQADPSAATFNTRKSIGQEQLGAAWDARLANGDSLRLSVYGGDRDVRQFLALSGAAITSSGGVVMLERFYSGLGARWARSTDLAGKPLALSAGLELDGMHERRRGYVNLSGVQGALRRDEDDEVFSTGAYVQGDWRFAERWSASAGLRTSRVSVSFDDHFIVPGNGNDSGKARFSATSPVAGLLYRATPSLNLYASYGRGFETPTLAELAYRPTGLGPNFDLKPSRSTQFEAGAKATVFGRSRINVALFTIETRDEIVVNSATGGRTTFKNASRTGRDGLEFSWDIPLNLSTNLYVSATRVNARFKESFTSTGPVSAGNALPAVPRDVLYAEATWRHPSSGFALALDVRRSSKLHVDDANSDAAEGYTLAKLRAGFEQAGRGWKMSEFVRIENVLDRKYIGSVIVADTNGRFFEPAPRRNGIAGVSATIVF